MNVTTSIQTAVIKAIDAYTHQNGGTLDLSNASGWHRNFLAMEIADAIEANDDLHGLTLRDMEADAWALDPRDTN